MKWLKNILYAPFMYWMFSRMRGILYIEFFAWMGFGLIVGLMF
jgi:hypothetical protein